MGMEDKDGKKDRIPNMYEDIPFCDFDDTNGTMDIPVKPVFIGGCCSAFKIHTVDANTGDETWISRFGSASDEDEKWFGFDCGETTGEQVCKNEHIQHKGYDQDGEVCHCYENRYNTQIPDIPGKASSMILSTFWVFTTALIVLF